MTTPVRRCTVFVMNVKAVQAEVRALANEKDAAILSGFFKTGPGEYGEGDRFLGIRVPAIRKLSCRYADLPPRTVRALLRSPYHEERLLALLILIVQFDRGNVATRKWVYELYLAHTAYINNWDLIDLTAYHIVGRWLHDRSRRPLHTLARSESLWERRIAMLATFDYIRRGEFDETLAIAEQLLHDSHDLIHKAVGWLLREVGKRDLAVEERFLARHYRVMPRTMLRYAIERFPERRRQAYLKGRV